MTRLAHDGGRPKAPTNELHLVAVISEPEAAGAVPTQDPATEPKPAEAGQEGATGASESEAKPPADEGAVAIDLVAENTRRARKVIALATKRDSTKLAAKAAKDEWEAEADGYVAWAAQMGEPLPLFDSPPAAAVYNAWRAVGLEQLTDPGLSPGLVVKLRAAKLDSLGDLADYSQAHEGFMDIDGVGPAAREKIQAAVDAYWRKNPLAGVVDEVAAAIDAGELGSDVTATVTNG
jgi:hypothetical protein